MEERSYRSLKYDSPEGTRELPVLAEIVPHVELRDDYVPYEEYRSHRRIGLPIALFAATCLSTFMAGMNASVAELFRPNVLAALLTEQWRSGLLYMAAVMGILLAHEMGHFLQAVRYRVPASLPFFIPMPFPPIGTMGAVIGMQGSQANRKELFDIGLSGPLAGLVLAIPITILGVMWSQVVPASPVPSGQYTLQAPLLMSYVMEWFHPNRPPHTYLDTHPFAMAGWVGLLITGLNMLPVSQLDGGHVAYALFGRNAHLLARAVMLGAIAFIVIAGAYNWMLMVFLVMAMGTDHPPTQNDHVPLGWWRYALGLASLSISVFCLAPIPISMG